MFVVGGISGLQDVTSRLVDREGPPGEGHSANPHFLSAFAELRKATISFVMSVRLSVCMEHVASHCTDFYEIQYLNIFGKPVEKTKV